MSNAKAHLISQRDAVMVVCIAAIFVLAIVYSVLSATTIGDNISTGGTLTVTGNSTLTNPAYASSTLQATGDGLFYDQLSAGASTNTPTTTFNVTGSGYFTTGLGVGFATTGTGDLHITGMGVFEKRVGVNGTTSPPVEFGVTGSGYFTGGLGVGYATTTGLKVSGGIGVFDGRVGVNASTSPAVEFGVTGSGSFSSGLGIGYATTAGLKVGGGTIAVFDNRIGVNATTSPYQELGLTGDAAQASAATTTLSLESTSTTQGGCIELKSSTENRWVRIYVSSGAGTSSNAFMMGTSNLKTGGTPLLNVELGRCQ